MIGPAALANTVAIPPAVPHAKPNFLVQAMAKNFSGSIRFANWVKVIVKIIAPMILRMASLSTLPRTHTPIAIPINAGQVSRQTDFHDEYLRKAG